MKLNRRQLLAMSAITAAPMVSGCSRSDVEVSIDARYPRGPFGAESTAEQVTADLDLRGKTALVTGCNSGLGYETMRVLALRGAHVIGTGRTMEKAQAACESVPGRASPVVLELGDHDSIVACAESVAGMGELLDIVVCNAGINTFGDLELVDGIERIFAINYLGHVILVSQLLPMMLQEGGGRIVHVSSRSGYRSAPPEGIDFDNLRGEGEFDASAAYGRSKLANALFSLSLAERLEGTGVTSNALHPGLVQTDIARTAPAPLRMGFELLGPLIAKTPEQGAATQVYVATSPLLSEVSGAYFEDCNPVQVSGDHHMFDAELAQRLWEETSAMAPGYVSWSFS
ncbi:MAG: SDR family oxidoreductase [Pseudomonadota bacterium]